MRNTGYIAGVITSLAALLMAACSPQQEAGPLGGAAAPAGEAEDVSVSDDVNIDVWLERMEVGSRELYSAREAVIEALELSEGAVIADIGVGTGLYTLLFADAVGPGGRIFAEDIEPRFLDLINRRAEDSGYNNITPVLGRENDVTLPAGAVDVVFIADTYHYFSDRESLMKSVYRALKPGGALVLIDYDLKPGEARPQDKSHVRFGRAGVISEVEYIGFEFGGEQTVAGLEENYFLRFLKPAN